MFGNLAHPRSVFVLWLACNGRLATKERLKKFGMVQDDRCVFYSQKESIDHLFFCCSSLKSIWENVLLWININHKPLDWERELAWVTRNCKGRSWHANILKCAIAELVYGIWKTRNDKVFGKDTINGRYIIIEREIIDNIVYKIWTAKKDRKHIASLII